MAAAGGAGAAAGAAAALAAGAAFALIAAAALVQWWTGNEITLADLSLLIAIYAVAVHERRRWLLVAAVAVLELGCLLAAARWSGAGAFSPAFLTLSAFTVAATVLGIYVRTRREQLEALRERARQLERERDRETALAAAAERARIARELHDVVAHSLSVMVALADGARLTRASDPDAGRRRRRERRRDRPRGARRDAPAARRAAARRRRCGAGAAAGPRAARPPAGARARRRPAGAADGQPASRARSASAPSWRSTASSRRR